MAFSKGEVQAVEEIFTFAAVFADQPERGIAY